MKPVPAPNLPGKTEWERFDNAAGRLLSVPKGALLESAKCAVRAPKLFTNTRVADAGGSSVLRVFLKEEARLKRQREKKRAKGIPTDTGACHACFSLADLIRLGQVNYCLC
ncbi:MAG: hypothetical protein JJE04_06990 [Acidobacteriia bacterium]|nr:hypothetical protein [Terriglobia bacterium]